MRVFIVNLLLITALGIGLASVLGIESEVIKKIIVGVFIFGFVIYQLGVISANEKRR